MSYDKFIKGLNPLLDLYGLEVVDGRLSDGNNLWGIANTIHSTLSSLWFYFNSHEQPYTNWNDMLSDLLVSSGHSNAGYIKQIMNYVKTETNWKYHFKLRVSTAGTISFSGQSKAAFEFEFNGQKYKPTSDDKIIWSGDLEKGLYDLIVYSTADNEEITFDVSGDAYIIYEWSSHKIDYEVTVTKNFIAYLSFSSKYKSIKKVSWDGAADHTEDYVNDTYTANYFDSGVPKTHIVTLFCDNIDEEIVVNEKLTDNVTVGTRWISY